MVKPLTDGISMQVVCHGCLLFNPIHGVQMLQNSVTRKGIWMIQGLLLLGSTSDISTLDSTVWSTQVSEYPQGVLEYSEYS